ncbi:hypothetical protein [Hydrogenimonas sp. SS33]|uniref:hypothetical protein n=1 Tax=Hydrogenimonas leucolamina TaxID=2954236 RepID=UPI00336BFDD3
MLEQDVAPAVDLLPTLPFRCRAMTAVLHAILVGVPFLFGLWLGSETGWLYGFFGWLASVFAGMIIVSKLKLHYVPLQQHELPHATHTILKWAVYKRFCQPERT